MLQGTLGCRHFAVRGILRHVNLAALLRSFEQKEEVGGRTQVWQNGSEVQDFPLRCCSVSVRTRPRVSQPFSAF